MHARTTWFSAPLDQGMLSPFPDSQPRNAGAAAPAPAPPRRPLWRLVWPVVLSVLLLFPALKLAGYAAQPFVRAQVLAQHPWYQLDNEEGAVLFQTLQIRKGFSIYHPLTDYPYVVGTYPPLFMAINALLIEPENPTFASGRAISTGAVLGIAATLFLIVGLRTWMMVLALLAGLLFLASYEVFNWIPYYRTDFLAIFFSVLGLGAVAVSPQERSARALSIVLFTLAFFTKQTQAAAPLAVASFFLLTSPSAGFRYLVKLLSAILIPFTILNVFTRGQFARHTVLYNMNRYSAGDLLVWVRHAWMFNRWLILAAVVALAGLVIAALAVRRNKVESEDERSLTSTAAAQPDCAAPKQNYLRDPVPLYALFSLAGFVASGKAGSAENYILEPLAAVALFVCDSAGRLAVSSLRGFGRSAAMACSFLIAGLLFAHAGRVSHLSPIMFDKSRNPRTSDFEAATEVVRELKSAKGDSWSELGAYNMFAGRSIFFQPFIMSELARQRRWDPESFYTDLRCHRFSLIVTSFDASTDGFTDIYTPEMIHILRTNYFEVRRITGGRVWNYYFYRPRLAPTPKLDIVMR